MSNRAYIGLGSNLASPVNQLRRATRAIDAVPACRLVKLSSLYASRPMGPADQPDYVNAVAAVETELTAHQLLDQLQRIELQQGRERKANRWGPRTLDLDILLFGNQVLNDERLTVPHYGMHQREFVLYPLQEIASTLVLPDGRTLQRLVDDCALNQLKRLELDPDVWRPML